MLTENSTEIKQNWDDVITITEEELKCQVIILHLFYMLMTYLTKPKFLFIFMQIHYDLATFHILREEYPKAKHHISQAKSLYEKLDTSKPLSFCIIKKECLDGYCLACDVPVEDKKPNLTQQLLMSTKDQYTVCTLINLARKKKQ